MLVEAPTGIQIEEITSAGVFKQLQPEWETLWRRSTCATPFQSPYWLLPWWKHFGGLGLWSLALRFGGELVGLAPFFVWQRKLLLIGTGITDYLDILIDPEWAEIGVASIMSVIARQSFRWEECDFQQLPPDSPLRHDGSAVQEVCPVLNVYRDIPMLKKAAYYLRHAAKLGEVRIEHATAANFDQCFAEFLRLHRLRWHDKGILNGAQQAFHHEVAARFLQADMLRLYLLRLEGEAIAAWYGFESKQRMYYYLGGFDPKFEKLSPGAILIAHAIHEAREHRAKAFDFLRGQERYKYFWGAQNSFTYRRLA